MSRICLIIYLSALSAHKRLFVGDLGNDVSDTVLAQAFEKYPTFSKARVVRKKADGKSKGYGFVAFADPHDFLKAWKEMDGECRLLHQTVFKAIDYRFYLYQANILDHDLVD